MPNLPEPPDLSFVRTGTRWPWKFWWRDDSEARDGEYEPFQRWWDTANEDGGDGPATWEEVAAMEDPQLVQIAGIGTGRVLLPILAKTGKDSQ